MMGAKSREAPRRARPKAALNLVRIANGMGKLLQPNCIEDTSFHQNAITTLVKTDGRRIPTKHRSLSAFHKANINRLIVQVSSHRRIYILPVFFFDLKKQSGPFCTLGICV